MTKIQVRRDTSANWASVNPTPAEGEPCFETDTGKLKVGNGQQPYNSLPYQTAEEIPVATTSAAGLVKPDGTTITITPDGTITSVGGALPDNVVTTDTVQTIRARKTIAPAVALRFGSDTGSGSIYFQNGTLFVTGEELVSGFKVNTLLTAANIKAAGTISVGTTKKALEYKSSGNKIVVGDDTNIEIVSTDTPTIVRNGQTYTNIDSGNISEQFNASKATITGWAFPSNRFTNLSLGATLTSYEAPDCGWFTARFRFTDSQANQARYCSMFNATTGLISFSINGSSQTGGGFGTCIPVRKGDMIQVNYGGTGVVNDYFRFVYAEGIGNA